MLVQEGPSFPESLFCKATYLEMKGLPEHLVPHLNVGVSQSLSLAPSTRCTLTPQANTWFPWFKCHQHACISSLDIPELLIHQLPSLFRCWMCNLQLKITTSKIELLISTAQLSYPSTKPILSRSCLSQENSVIFYPGVLDSFSLIPTVNPFITLAGFSSKVNLVRTHLAVYHHPPSPGSRSFSL